MRNYPTIGIRPVIDGRLGGIRESLEDTTRGMAKRVGEFLTKHVKYPDGSSVKYVIPDHCIGRVPESYACDEIFEANNVGLTITVTPCWCYGTETIDMNLIRPKAIWGFNGTERPGAVYLAAALAGHTQKGVPAFGIYGKNVQESDDETIPKDVQEKLLRFVRSGLSVAIMRKYTYLSIGSVSMGIAGSIIKDDFFQSYLGMRNEYVDSTEIIRRIEQGIYDQEEFRHALNWTKENCKEGKDYNPKNQQKSRQEKDKDWEFVVKMTMVIRDLMAGNKNLDHLGFGEEAMGHHAILAGFQGQRQWTDYLPNGDFSEAILNSSFDWNGRREPHLVATENDSLNGVVMLFGYLLTHTAQIFADVRTYWSPEAVERVTGTKLTGKVANGILHMINSGSCTLDGTGEQEIEGQSAIKPHYRVTDEEVSRCLDATSWHIGMLEYFRGGGFSSKMLTRGGMPMTMSRVNLVKGLGPVLQIAEGWSVDIPDDVHSILDQRTNPTWPTTWFVPRINGKGAFRDVYSVMNNWGANHCSISYEHIGADLITLASMLRIPVCMHNVPEELIFRPSSWASFGMDNESADYRACQNFGPLYGSLS